ncbi:helix-turn-helix protein [Paenibacillus cellulosilyticus]|uniref:Helix-turn-helix protein n=1 Tax=Paenibacillus cellulosilyticus TaxID=375489 RepID=A0A2V2YSH2_9BACL|nr:helix-turn-helix transcriptional regulator [Paenibacillus cellulosilyticus]PWW01172.1 helix-turn-helix protein [Paenibacillus cellulosilyticus]QKS46867.1 helix-turn-helix transcriptional regulator [Paenibacillus cellulosilyticus]
MESKNIEMGRRLKESREKKGYKQNRIAKLLGIHNSTLAKYESGEREPDLNTITSLSEMYEVPVNYLISGEVEPTDSPLLNIDPERLKVFEALGKLNDEQVAHILKTIELITSNDQALQRKYK